MVIRDHLSVSSCSHKLAKENGPGACHSTRELSKWCPNWLEEFIWPMHLRHHLQRNKVHVHLDQRIVKEGRTGVHRMLPVLGVE